MCRAVRVEERWAAVPQRRPEVRAVEFLQPSAAVRRSVRAPLRSAEPSATSAAPPGTARRSSPTPTGPNAAPTARSRRGDPQRNAEIAATAVGVNGGTAGGATIPVQRRGGGRHCAPLSPTAPL